MDDRTIDRLFSRLGAEFGHKFTSNMPTAESEKAAKAAWADRLSGLSMDELHHGVKELAKYAEKHDGWPPGAAEFRALCRPPREMYERPEFQRGAIPQQKADNATALSYYEQMKKQLRGAV